MLLKFFAGNKYQRFPNVAREYLTCNGELLLENFDSSVVMFAHLAIKQLTGKMGNYQKTKIFSLLYFVKNLREKISCEENEISIVRKIVFFPFSLRSRYFVLYFFSPHGTCYRSPESMVLNCWWWSSTVSKKYGLYTIEIQFTYFKIGCRSTFQKWRR